MEELINNGPVEVAFDVSPDFMYYSSGIYEELDLDTWLEIGGEKPEWTFVSHAVLLYGWGEENGVKYWEVQNSWGTGWGDSGMFKIKRGVDELGIESMVEGAIPYIVDKRGKPGDFLRNLS